MKRSFLSIGILLGFLSSLILMAISYLANTLLGLPFLPFDLFNWLARTLPGDLIRTTIAAMVSIITTLHLGQIDTTAKIFENIQALLVVAVTGAVFGLVLGWIASRRRAWLGMAGFLGGILLWLGIAVAEISTAQPPASLLIGLVWFLILLVGWGWQLARLLERLALPQAVAPSIPAASSEAEPPVAVPGREVSRRNFILLGGASLVSFFVLVLGLRATNQAAAAPIPVTSSGSAGPTPIPDLSYGPQYTSGPAASPSPAVLAQRIQLASGTRPEITDPQDFYRIDINAFPPQVDAGSWRYNLKGMVQNPLSLTIDDIRALPVASQAVTLSCISNPLGGDLISSNYWTGVRFKDVLAKAGLASSVTDITIQSVDGYYESIPVAEAMDDRTLLVYAMNGQPLLPAHGFPLRIFIPNHYGMKQPKWITQMVAADKPGPGYWVDRGWSQAAIPQTTSVIDTVSVNRNDLQQTGIFPLGGIAWAGARGISKVEVQVDNAPWVPAQLRTPPVGPLTWVQWRYDWTTVPGSHTVQVRATDGAGALQTATFSNPGPEGATGIYSVNLNI
jgi:DMSO/TMAO reductase YedYZ molybdopterin-dependent catalytic subunit